MGSNSHGATFKDSFHDFESAIMRPYTDFLRTVYRKSYIDLDVICAYNTTASDVRASRAITLNAQETNSPITHVEEDRGSNVLPLPCTTALSPRLSPKATITTVASITECSANPEPSLTPSLSVATPVSRPKPTPPGYASKKALKERAAAEEAATAEANRIAVEAASAEANRITAEAAEAASARVNHIASDGAKAASAEANHITTEVTEAASAEALASGATNHVAAIASVATTPSFDSDPLNMVITLQPSYIGSPVNLLSADAGPEDTITRKRRKVIPTAGGAEIARQQTLKEAKAKKAAETRAKNTAAKRTIGDEQGGSSSKKARTSVDSQKTGGKRKRR